MNEKTYTHTNEDTKTSSNPDVSKWVTLPYAKKASIIHKCWWEVSKLVKKQLALIEGTQKGILNPNLQQTYAIEMIKSFWEEASYAFRLSKTNDRMYLYHPVRSCFEKLVNVSYFWQEKDSNIRDQLVRNEFLRQFQYLYRRAIEEHDEAKSKQFKDEYNRLATKDDAPIDQEKRIKSMLGKNVETLCQQAGFIDHIRLYQTYRDLCEYVHSGLIQTATLKDTEQFVNSMGLQFLCRSCLDMLWVADSLLYANFPLRNEIIALKKRCEAISFSAFA